MTATATSTTANPPPTKKGWVNTFYRHYKGKKLGPYHVRRWKVGYKIHREYIKPEDVERVKAECRAHREKQKLRREANREHNKLIDNFHFLGTMLNRYDTGKVVTPAMEAYIHRLHHEGKFITGRPQMRRKVKRSLATVGSKTYIVKTVFELDGTTKVFMVPIFLNSLFQGPKSIINRFMDIALEAFDIEWGNKAEKKDVDPDDPELWSWCTRSQTSDHRSPITDPKQRFTTCDLRKT